MHLKFANYLQSYLVIYVETKSTPITIYILAHFKHKVKLYIYNITMTTIKNIIIIFGPLICGIVVGFLTKSSIYSDLNKPPFSPPGIVFPIAWGILYLLMGISAYLIIKETNKLSTLKTYIVQLIINLIWPFLFFNLKFYNFSAIWLSLLIYLVLMMIKEFSRIKKIASYLQFPYLLWLLFALYLNIGVAFLN